MTRRIRGRPLGRRALLKLGSAGLAALGAGSLRSASPLAQTPGSGQGGGGGPRPPAPPAPESIVNPRNVNVEDWTEPWIWRPSEWPGQPLVLNLVGNPSPPRAVSPGNRFTPLYSWNGASPGPTIRVRGNERLRITVRNHLGPNLSLVPKGPAPDPFELVPAVFEAAVCRMAKEQGRDCPIPVTRALINEHFHELNEAMGAPLIDMSCHSGPINIPHASHTTNVHTHGLHVEPGINANGTFGDFAMSRVLPHGDARASQGVVQDARIPRARRRGPLRVRAHGPVSPRPGGKPETHPPGTHWYHPHAHGATHDQVASGLAGFLVVEGDVDDAINLAMTGEARPDVTKKTGRYDYRERLILLQRVEVNSADLDRSRRQQVQFPPPTAVNGAFAPTTMFMRPGAVERWRVLNGSVDGRGFKQFMVLEGQFVFSDRQLWRVLPGEGAGAPPRFEPATRQHVADATRQLYLLAMDGITLVQVENGRARHAIKDLAKQNAGSRNPLDRAPGPNETQARADLTNVEACYRDGESLRSVFVRPNQVYMVERQPRGRDLPGAARLGRQGLHDRRAGVRARDRQLPTAAAGRPCEERVGFRGRQPGPDGCLPGTSILTGRLTLVGRRSRRATRPVRNAPSRQELSSRRRSETRRPNPRIRARPALREVGIDCRIGLALRLQRLLQSEQRPAVVRVLLEVFLDRRSPHR